MTVYGIYQKSFVQYGSTLFELSKKLFQYHRENYINNVLRHMHAFVIL
jgi:hypothetical protein